MNVIKKLPIKKLIGLKKETMEDDTDADANADVDYISINKLTKTNKKKQTNMNMFKLVIILFLLYIFISSSLFKNTFLKLFGNKFVNNGNSTCLGTILQGVFLVLFYMLFATLINRGVI